MKQYQQRMINEYNDLNIKIEKLDKFINNIKNGTSYIKLKYPIELLEAQLRAMQQYSLCLNKRIKAEEI